MNRFRAFMNGRYGIDPLNIALIILGCIITFITSFLRIRYYRLFAFIPYILALLRILSRNIPARENENAVFMKFWQPIQSFIQAKKHQHDDFQHKYYKCPNCKHTLRVPAFKGKIAITCPYCQKNFKRNTGRKPQNNI